MARVFAAAQFSFIFFIYLFIYLFIFWFVLSNLDVKKQSVQGRSYLYGKYTGA